MMCRMAVLKTEWLPIHSSLDHSLSDSIDTSSGNENLQNPLVATPLNEE